MGTWQTQNIKTLSDLQKTQLKNQQELINRLITLLAAKDPLAYQAIIAAEQSSGTFESVSASDEAEAERYAKLMAEGGFIGYDYNTINE
jgi:hypothetical protein